MSSSAPKLCVDDVSMTFKTPTGVFHALAPVMSFVESVRASL